uniref:Piwi domain-containing protein n=1 Tax=Angiostrongylus cantonensis TaxID=6313 RepID=A0A0K0D7L8_ANGCA
IVLDTIKLLEVEYQIVSQEIRTSKVSAVIFKNQNQTLDSVVMPSVLGWGASCTANPQRFVGGYVYVEPRESDVIVGDIIKKHRMATSITARHIFVYFSGIPEGEFSVVRWNLVVSSEDSLEVLCEPDVTALAVSKDHNERIYRSRISGKRAVEQNIRGGTVIDTKIVEFTVDFAFYFVARASPGTAKTPKYSLIADNSQIPLDAIEGLTYGLCYLHAIVSSTVAIPIPLVVADRCAKRGHNVYAANLKKTFRGLEKI